jgi:predicted Fe-Mo cluster-binding NifX family protein
MKIAVSATESELDARIDERFGRCPCFVITETEGPRHEMVANPHAERGSGAGIQAARMLIERGVSVVLTGRCGPNAADTLAAAGVEIFTGYSGTVRQAMERFNSEASPRGDAETPPSQADTQGDNSSDRRDAGRAAVGPPPGGRRGAGRGRGRGSGRGLGGRRGRESNTAKLRED